MEPVDAPARRWGVLTGDARRHDAEVLVAAIHPNGSDILGRLLKEKDNAHYGAMGVNRSTAQKMVGWARCLSDFADAVLTS